MERPLSPPSSSWTGGFPASRSDGPFVLVERAWGRIGGATFVADAPPVGCSGVVGVPRKLMWISWLIQPGPSLTSRPEQNSARRAVTNCVEPEGWRIVGHNESEGMQLRNRAELHIDEGTSTDDVLPPRVLVGLLSLSEFQPGARTAFKSISFCGSRPGDQR